MGVTGLWTVVAPTARPTKLETLNRKRLAVDASIWIYQFLKAVRDKEGNALRNSHVIGFFRRICKLLYFGIKPVFVFDGGAPVLKRETIRQRVRRREGRRDDAARTAGKLLAVQVARAAEDEAKRQREEREHVEETEELPTDQDLVYVDEIGMNQQQRQVGRGFKKKDQYHLPDLDVNIADMGAPNDPRVMSQAELEAYALQFHSGEDINFYDFSKIDFDSPFFQSLPAGDKYNILNAARLRSRLRMGYSKDQLDDMFPDRMAFSKFQIERVKERNELTQRLMHVSGMNEGDWDMGGRIAGERGKEYVLVKSEGVEGGWALGVVSNKKGVKKENAIDLENDNSSDEGLMSSEEEEEFEDVAIEGVNRIPQSWKRKRHQTRDTDYDMSYEEAAERIAKKRKAVYDARRKVAEQESRNPRVQPLEEPIQDSTDQNADNGIFVAQDKEDDSEDEAVFEDVTMTRPADEDEDDLQRAIAMSLEKSDDQGGFIVDEGDPQPAKPVDDEDVFDLQAAIAESRASKYQPKTNVRSKSPVPTKKKTFGGPLPFESLNLGQSLLGKKKAKKVEEDLSGGFDRGVEEGSSKNKAAPMPNWFNTAPDMRPSRPGNMDHGYESDDHVTFGRDDVDRRDTLRQRPVKEAIDLDDDDAERPARESDIEVSEVEGQDVEVFDDEEQAKLQDEADRKVLEAEEVAASRRKALEEEREKRYALAQQIADENQAEEEPTMGDVAEVAQAMPPAPSKESNYIPQIKQSAETRADSPGSEEVEWSDSDQEQPTKPSKAKISSAEEPAGGRMPDEQANKEAEEEDEDLFEDVEQLPPQQVPSYEPDTPIVPENVSTIDQSMFIDDDEETDVPPNSNENGNQQQQEFIEDDSDEELMRQLANEAEEHLRFSNELNNTRAKSPTQAMRDYENELKQLRNQQKRDRRDADEVTQTMIQECQALLRLFGLPYITAPMEAEAQCAELVHLGLVDGIVTDDSDIFLFGGTRIYKNMFNAAKFVECYLTSDLEKEYALERRKLIRFAHLLGSDYTEGIPGIGPVTALEIISDFTDLSEFKDWTLKIQLGSQTPSVMEGLLTTPFRRKLKRQVQRKLFLPTSFPDLRVDEAYLKPEVDSNPEEFQWGVPDLDKLRSFLMATIGWSPDRTDEILVPVIRDMNKRDVEGVQSNLTRYFTGGIGVGAAAAAAAAPGRGIGGYNKASAAGDAVEGTAPRNRTGKESGRMKNAYTRLRGEAQKEKKRRDVGDIGEDRLDVLQEDNGGGGGGGGDTGDVRLQEVERSGRGEADDDDDDDVDADNDDDEFRSANKRAKKSQKKQPSTTTKAKGRRKRNRTDNF